MPATAKTVPASGQTMIEAYFLKKVAKPFEWVVKGVEHRRATYRVEVIGVEDGTLHVGVHRVTFESFTDRKGNHVQLPDVAVSVANKLTREEILDRAVVMADQEALTARGQGFPPRLMELLDATDLGHLYPYERR